jgi:ParB family chromosome partitioning protein
MAEQKLGKGLGALFGGITFDDELEPAGNFAKADGISAESGVTLIPILQIDNNIDQPRKIFSEELLRELADSIKEHGVIQPILVTPVGNRFMIIAGERRWRASKMAGLKEIPALVKLFNVKQIAEIAIIENLQRDDLSDIELARGIKKLMDEYSLTQEKVALRLGKPRSTVANMLRLTMLPQGIQEMLERKKLTYGHAIRLLALQDESDKIKYARAAAENELSVRELGDLIDGRNADANGRLFNVKQFEILSKKSRPSKEIEIREQEKLLSRAAGTKVRIEGTMAAGRVILSYYSADELNRIVQLLKKRNI